MTMNMNMNITYYPSGGVFFSCRGKRTAHSKVYVRDNCFYVFFAEGENIDMLELVKAGHASNHNEAFDNAESIREEKTKEWIEKITKEIAEDIEKIFGDEEKIETENKTFYVKEEGNVTAILEIIYDEDGFFEEASITFVIDGHEEIVVYIPEDAIWEFHRQ